MNEVVAGGDNSIINMSTHPVQLDSVEKNTVTSNSPVRGESATSNIAETTLPFMQPSNANLRPMPQVGNFCSRKPFVAIL